ncbi:MAG TPA: protein kinase [Gemmatimonadaceae bacterium]|nr:protein kinase [Gemmatimonadaceae bacterium]
MTQCQRCGAAIAPGSRFCPSCGRQVLDPGAATLLVGAADDALLAEVRHALSGEYDIDREVGRGAMAVVYRATEAGLGRRVALKVLPPEMTLNRELTERFKREARLAASLEHPNIIPVYREGQAGRFLFMAMKFIEGRSLEDIIASQGPLPVPVVLHVLRSATSALAYAHERGIVHRDIKSANILVDRDGRVVVTDFGIARAAEDASLTSTGTMVGTPYFMSPEQCAARRIGPQSDQYSLGVVAFQMLTGSVPFQAESLPGIMHHHFYTQVPDVTTARLDVPQLLRELIDRALAKKPEHRFASSQAMLAAVEAVAFPEEDKRQGLAHLRDLAHGAPIPVVGISALPALASSIRLTPQSAPTVQPRVASLSRWAIALIVATVLGAGGAAAVVLSRAPAPVPVPAAIVVAPPATEPIETRREIALPLIDSSARQTAAPVAEPQATGLLRVRAFPADAEIRIDGKLLGRGVVLDSTVRVGSHRLRVSAPGYKSFDTTVTIVADEITALARIALPTQDPQ